MAKSKLDWFKLDCQTDDKIALIEAEFGLIGFAVVVKLWQKIYGAEGYYCEWNEDVALVFAKKINASAGAVSEIVARCIKRGIFDEGMYKKFGILTSHGIQARYFDAVSRRKYIEAEKRYLLLCNTQKSADADSSSKNVDISSENADINSQRRREKKREEKRRRDKRQTEEQPTFSAVSLTNKEHEELVRLSDLQTVDSYVKKLSEWQMREHKISKKPYVLIKRWIEEDTSSKPSKETSYDLDEWERFALSYDPNERK